MRDLDRQILRLAVPALGALVAEPLYILADTAVVGRALGTDSLAGLAVASSVLLLGYSLFVFLAYGTTAAVARLMGAGDEREAAHQAVQGLWLALALGIVVAAITAVLAQPLLRMLGAEGTVLTEATVYLRISLLGVPAMMIVLAGTGYLRGLQDTRTPLLVAVGSSVLNLLLGVWWIVGLDFGIGASAASTVVAQWASAAVYVGWVVVAVRRHTVPLAPRPRTLSRLAVVGRDLFLRTAALRLSFLLAVAVATRIGTEDVAAHQVAFEIWNLLALTLDALAIAGQSMIGHHLGAGSAPDARTVGRRLLELGVAAGALLGLVVLAARPWLPSLFTTDESVATLAGFVLLFVAAMQPVNGAVFVLDGLLIGAGDMGFLGRAMWIALAVFAPLAIAVAVLGLGLGWLWAALTVFMIARLVVLALRWRTDRWAVTGAVR
ncbi:MAG: MATE family efflux transporter [Acidimicrobiales bacterium]|nr:MATE family efflux transporter [Acidimicrobiales bacterium]